MKFHRIKALSIPFNPWVYFSIFLASNSLLSYFSLPLTLHWTALGAGLLLPFIMAWITYSPAEKPAQVLLTAEFLPSVPIGLWIFIGVLAVFIRFYQLTGLSFWPRFDEGMVDFYGLRVMQGGMDRFLFSSAQVPPLYVGWLGLNFKCWGSYFTNSLFWPAFFSSLTVPVAYQAARQYFSRSFSLVCVLLTAFSFWPWYVGRFAFHVTVIPLAEVWVLGWMGKWFQSRDSGKSFRSAVILGVGLGLVCYAVYLHWMSVLVVVVLTVVWVEWRGARLPLIGFFLGLGLVLLPFAVIVLWKEPHVYLNSLSFLGGTLPLLAKIDSALSNTWLLFWGTPPPYYTFQPVWGGFFNPILGSLVFMGLLEALRNWRIPLYQWLCGAGILWMLPGMLARDWECFRIVPVLAVLIPLAALGFARLSFGFSPRRSVLALLLLLLPSVGLDIHQLQVYHHLWDSPKFWQGCNKSIERYRAYQILKPKFSSEGPGLIFSDFVPGDCDPTLTLADYDFNPVVNPALSFGQAKWAAVLTNVGYKPLLDSQFGPTKTYFLSKDLLIPDGGQMLWVIPITDSNRAVFERWYRAGQVIQGVVDDYLQDISYKSGDLHQRVIPALEKIHPFFQQDRFLEACYWEKVADDFLKAGDFPTAIQDLDQAVHSAYPAAHLDYRLGVLWLHLQNTQEAEKAFKKATEAPLDLTQSSLLLPGLTPAPRP